MTNAHPVALVTGVTRGLGRAIAESLLREGWTVIGDGRSNAVDPPTGCRFVLGSVTDPDHRRQLRACVSEAGGLDLLVNNAGTLGPTPMPAVLDLTEEALVDTVRQNVAAPVLLTADLIDLVRDGGVVVNMTSDAAVEAYEGWGAYGASKAALEHLTRVLQVEVPRLRFLAVDPGDLRTDMHQAAFPGEDISDRTDPADVAPVFARLVDGAVASGRHRAADLLGS